MPHLSLISSEECSPARHSAMLHTTPWSKTTVPGDYGNGNSLLVFATFSITEGWAPSILTADLECLLFLQGMIQSLKLLERLQRWPQSHLSHALVAGAGGLQLALKKTHYCTALGSALNHNTWILASSLTIPL